MDATTKREPATDLIRRLMEIQAMRTGALRDELTRLTGVPTKSWNKLYLLRKVAWLTQAAARQTSDAVNLPTLADQVRDVPRSPVLNAPIQVLPGGGIRDPRLPRPGIEIVKVYRGLRLTVQVLEGHLVWNGSSYRTWTAVAKAVTGQPFINGRLFFGLTPRQRGKGQTERSTRSR